LKETEKAIKLIVDSQQPQVQEILTQLPPDEKAIVIVGRVYNTCDLEMTLDLPEKLRDLSMLAIPLDFLPLESLAREIASDHPNMYWKAGQKILGAARMIANDPRLFGLYLTNFSCGPDSYLLKFFSKEVEGKPFLTIEIIGNGGNVDPGFFGNHPRGRRIKSVLPKNIHAGFKKTTTSIETVLYFWHCRFFIHGHSYFPPLNNNYNQSIDLVKRLIFSILSFHTFKSKRDKDEND